VGSNDLVHGLDVNWYLDPAIYDVERREVFAREWVLVGYEFQVREPGSFISEDLAGFPVIVWRSPQGQLVSFLNICPHRAGPIMWNDQACQANLVCRYHGWAFDSSGNLRNTPGFGAEMPEDMNLTMVRVEVWRGMIFVCLHADTPPLMEWFGTFPTICEKYPIESYRFHAKTVRQCTMNWKTYSDNFLEGYHVPYIHLGMSRDIVAKDYEVRMKGDRRWNIHTSEPKTDESLWDGVWVYFWPNFSIDIFPGGISIERWLPRGHDRTDLIFEYFFADANPEVEAIVKTSEEVADEDVRACEVVHYNMKSGAYKPGPLSPRHEAAVAIFHETVRDAVEKGGPARAT
jgi:choline monooxygenase